MRLEIDSETGSEEPHLVQDIDDQDRYPRGDGQTDVQGHGRLVLSPRGDRAEATHMLQF